MPCGSASVRAAAEASQPLGLVELLRFLAAAERQDGCPPGAAPAQSSAAPTALQSGTESALVGAIYSTAGSVVVFLLVAAVSAVIAAR
jgi:hypothetical protein